MKPEQRDKTGTKTALPLKPVSANIAEEKLAAYEAAKSSALSGLQVDFVLISGLVQILDIYLNNYVLVKHKDTLWGVQVQLKIVGQD